MQHQPEGKRLKVLIKSAWGSADPTQASFPFHHANAFAEAGHAVQIFLLGEAVSLMRAVVAGSVVAAMNGDASLSRRPAPASWSAKEVVCPLRDIEELFLLRFRSMLALDEPTFLVLGGNADRPSGVGNHRGRRPTTTTPGRRWRPSAADARRPSLFFDDWRRNSGNAEVSMSPSGA